MPKFQVFIPAAPPDLPVDITLRVMAENWLPAIKLGMERICGAQMASNLLVDVQDDGTVEVTDPATNRVFQIVELPAVTPFRPIVRRAERAPWKRIGRAPADLRRESILTDVFARVLQVHDAKSVEDGLAFLVDLAGSKVTCDAGFALLARGDALVFVAGRGEKAAETLRAGVPIPVGRGIVGFCAQEVVALAVSDVQKDPRFFRKVEAATGFETRSLLACPIVKDGRVYGALELKNKKSGPFDAVDMAVLSYLAHHAATFLERRELSEPL